jgi:hypothetical protein
MTDDIKIETDKGLAVRQGKHDKTSCCMVFNYPILTEKVNGVPYRVYHNVDVSSKGNVEIITFRLEDRFGLFYDEFSDKI